METYRPDRMIMAAVDWAQRHRVEIVDCRFDMAIRVAWVSRNLGGTSEFRIDRV